MDLKIELEQETDGRWIAEVVELPGVMVYGDTSAEALESSEGACLARHRRSTGGKRNRP